MAARENAVSDQSIHQLDLVKKITLQDKITIAEFASDVQKSLYTGLEDATGMKDRGVSRRHS